MGIKLEDIKLNLKLGFEYEIIKPERNNSKENKVHFKGILVHETEYFYVFRCRHGYCECFLKVDFAINECSIRRPNKKGDLF